uniref:Uncharacterized protein n=1 Tax=Branchiostoma floridae TaxID=7739 RepID=C3ZUI7_BRAFL|eukprot:XP_002587815.1 hypothetical protein BRAFLDRAFT_92264 [Branchiostoma floridae]
MPTRDPTASVVVGLCSYTRGYDLNWRLHASLRRVCSPDATATKNCAMYMLLLSGDVETNPGPCKLRIPAPLGGKQRDTHLRGYYDLRVDWSDLAVCCDNCDICYHSSPVVMSPDTGNSLPRDETDLSLPAANLSNKTPPDSSHSTDCSQDSVTAGILPPKSHNWRTLVVNADGIIGKVAQFANLVSYTKPDAILMCETKLGPHHHSAEFMPPGYSPPVRRDRASGAGGVLIAVRDCYTAVEVEQPSEI